jgi:YebC/PmpR family DNA-binding regulatory protein
VAVLVEVLTDNRNRAGSEIRSLFTRGGGSLAEPGAVAWQFERKAVIIIPKAAPVADEDEVMMVGLDAGMEDLEDQGDTWQLTAAPTDLGRLRDALEGAGVKVTSAELTMVPTSTISLESEADARKVLRVVDALEEHDDVQAVYANFDIPDNVLQLVTAEA